MGVPFRLSGEPFEGKIYVERVTSCRLAHLANVQYSGGRYNISRWERRSKGYVTNYITCNTPKIYVPYSSNLKRIRTGEKIHPCISINEPCSIEPNLSVIFYFMIITLAVKNPSS